MKDYTIIRRRVVTQISTDQYRAKSKKEALEMADKDQASGDSGNESNEWHDLDDVIEYHVLTDEAILEANPVKE